MASAEDAGARIATEVLRAARSGPSVAVATVIDAPPGATPEAGARLLVRADGSRLGSLGGSVEDAVAEDCLAALTQVPRQPTQALYYRPQGNRVHRLEARDDGEAFEVMVEVIEAPATLLIVGGGHIGLSLATMGAQAGFSVAVLDDREMFANAERFPMADRVMAGEFGGHLAEFPIGSNTFVVLVSRGHKQDELALGLVAGRGAAYVGMIGSRRRVSTVLRHLAEVGHALEALERVHTPIGFDIGAETPEEIAVSILAEVIMARRGGSGQQMMASRPRIGAREAEEV